MSLDGGPLRYGRRGLFPHPPQHGWLRHDGPWKQPTHHGRGETVRGLYQRCTKLRGRGGGITVARVFITSALFVWMAVVVCQPGSSLVTRSAHWNFSKKNAEFFFLITRNDDYVIVEFQTIIFWKPITLKNEILWCIRKNGDCMKIRPLTFSPRDYAVEENHTKINLLKQNGCCDEAYISVAKPT
jgi:hypothetical protein